MAWTYTAPDTSTGWANPVHEIRFLVGDTAQIPQSLEDAEIAYLLAQSDAALLPAAALVAHSMADRFLSAATRSKTIGEKATSETYSGQGERFRQKARDLENKAGTASSGASIGLVVKAQPDRVFTMRQMDA